VQQAEFTFNEAISFMVNCDGQAEVDHFWEKLIAGGGAESQCGWLKDKFGVSWQVVPTELFELLSDPDPARAQRAMGALMQMRKIDIEKLRQATADEGKTVITVQATVHAPIGKVWQLWTQPEHITQWNNASEDWHTPRAENDLRKGGSFSSRMEAKDGSFGFDFGGIYDEVVENQHIEYTLGDGRKVQIHFSEVDGGTFVMEIFEAENMNSVELQRGGWQAIGQFQKICGRHRLKGEGRRGFILRRPFLCYNAIKKHLYQIMAKSTKPDDAVLVAAYMRQLEHPLKAEIAALQQIIKAANPAIAERIKWNAPSYYTTEDFLTFNHRMLDKVHLIFHHVKIAEIKSPILEGDYKDRRMVYFENMDAVLAKQAELESVIHQLIGLMQAA